MSILRIYSVFIGLILLVSCSKEPNVMTQYDYGSLGSKMYCFNKNISYKFKIFPDKVLCSMNSDGLIIVAYNIPESNENRFKLSIYSNFRTKGRYELKEISSKKWGVISLSDDDFTYYTQESSSFENYIYIEQIDKSKKLISGSFMIDGFEAIFNNVDYTDGLAEASYLNSFEFNYDNSGHKSTNFVDRDGDKTVAYISGDIFKLKITDWSLGTRTLNNNAIDYSITNNYSSGKYVNTGGLYSIEKIIINNHAYTKITLNATLHNSYYEDFIEVENSVFLLY